MYMYLSISDEVACIDPVKCKEICDNPSGCSNIAYPKLVLELAPTGTQYVMTIISSAIFEENVEVLS